MAETVPLDILTTEYRDRYMHGIKRKDAQSKPEIRLFDAWPFIRQTWYRHTTQTRATTHYMKPLFLYQT